MDYSLDNIADRIYSHKTREYFKEVLTSYQIGNYRSAVVMLWSVVVADLLYKVEHLVDMNNDRRASGILKDVANMQEKNERSSQWEGFLLQRVQESAKLINIPEYENLKYLQTQRHLCAHPTLDNDRKLHSPNKETTRSLITNALQDLLIKPPFYTQDVLTDILRDLSENKEIFENRRDQVEKYLNSRYLERLDEDVQKSIFRSLWKIVFRLENDQCSENRLINLRAIEVIGKRLEKELVSIVQKEPDYYSLISNSKQSLTALVVFLSSHGGIYSLLKEHVKIALEQHIEEESASKLYSWFIYESKEKYFEESSKWIEENRDIDLPEQAWRRLLCSFDTEEWEQRCCELMSIYYGASYSYDCADARFNEVILPHLKYFKKESLVILLDRIEKNGQTTERRQAYLDHKHIFERIKELSVDLEDKLIIDLSKYHVFQRYLEQE